jgi:hypothetical protein
MTRIAKDSDIAELLARHGIAPPCGERAGDLGGRIADVHIGPDDNGVPMMSVALDGIRVASRCPLDREHALAMIASLRDAQRLPDDVSFAHMLANLLINMSRVYTDSRAQALAFESVHLQPTDYAIRRVRVVGRPPHAKHRLASDAHDRNAAFSHRHGEDVRYPR